MSRNFWYGFLFYLVYPFYFITHPFRATGVARVPEGSVVIAGNHTDMADPVVTCLALGMGRKVRPMAKLELRSVPLVGWLLDRAGAIFVDRGAADLKAVKTALKHLKDGGKLLVFPEGTRVKDGQQVEAKDGAALMATRTGSPLVPVYISPNKRWFRCSHVVFGDPYYPEFEGRKPTSEELDSITKELMSRIQQLGESI